jgi:SAM-dependent methyltransferase
MRPCPICKSDDILVSVSRARLPVLQNRVYRTREEALRSPTAPFRLGTCRTCAFSFNALFEPNLVVYDEFYDNEVPSPAFLRYYEHIAAMLTERFQLTSGRVYDIGCGKGAFLRTLCRLAPGIRGVGMDPSCEPFTQDNCTLIRDVFRPQHFSDDAKLVLLRHVLEHIDDPVAFASALRNALPDVPIFVEVPDLHWIYRNDAFWDFCYEHCNYFSGASLRNVLGRAGFQVVERKTSFGDQYQWAICTPTASCSTEPPHALEEIEIAQNYQAREAARVEAVLHRVDEARTVVLWGMATKGVILANLMGADHIAGGIDINPRKQGHFVPGSGVEIHRPEWLQTFADESTVLIMNPNYADEIREQISSMGIQPRVMVV